MEHRFDEGARRVSRSSIGRVLRRVTVAVGAAAMLLVAAPVHAGAQVAYVPVDGSPDAVLDPGSVGARGSEVAQDCSVIPFAVPEGAVAWQVVLPQADTLNPENVFDSVTLEFATAGSVNITSFGPPSAAYAIAVTPTDDVLLNGSADGSESAGDGFPAFFVLAHTCYTPPPPPPPPPDDTTTTTTTTVPPPPPTSPPANPSPPSGPTGPSAPPTQSQVLWSAAAVRLPFAGSLFALKPAVATTTTTTPAPPATPGVDPIAVVASSGAASATPGTSTPLDRGKLAGTSKKINGAAASVEISSAGPLPWGSLLLGAVGASVVVFLIMAVSRRTDHRARLRRDPRLS
jgi:hypothetical protein